MKITRVIIGLMKNSDKVKAMASITLDDCFVVKNLKVIKSEEGKYFIGMPQYKTDEEEWNDITFPITKEFREELTEKILIAYSDKVRESKGGDKKDKKKDIKKERSDKKWQEDDELPF